MLPAVQWSQSYSSAKTWRRTEEGRCPALPLLCVCLQDTTVGKMVLLVWPTAGLLVPCVMGIQGCTWLHGRGCPIRQCSCISRTSCYVELAAAFLSWSMRSTSETQHVLFVFLSLQRPDQWTCCVNQRKCCPLEYVQWSCVCALL